jgi:hypothetical protein
MTVGCKYDFEGVDWIKLTLELWFWLIQKRFFDCIGFAAWNDRIVNY